MFMSEILILAVCFQLKQLKKQPEKKFRPVQAKYMFMQYKHKTTPIRSC